jgi:hypothetical protein
LKRNLNLKTEKKLMEEKRRLQRFKMNLLINVFSDDMKKQKETKNYMASTNISGDGVHLKTDKPFAKDTLVHVEIFLPDSSSRRQMSLIETRGVVVRSEEGSMAIRFYEDYRVSLISNDRVDDFESKDEPEDDCKTD